jgi:hypothetical protein
MEGQAKFPQPLAQNIHHPLCVTAMFEADDKIVRVANEMRHAAKPRLNPLLEPPIEHMVKIDIAEQRRKHRPLGRPTLRRAKLLAIQHTHMQALPNEPQQRPVSDPFLEHLQQHRAIYAVKERRNISLQDPIHLSPGYDPVQSAKRIMSTASRATSVGTLQEVLFIDGLQHLPQDVLHEFVLKRRNADWPPLLTVFLGDVSAKDGLVAIPHGPHPIVQVSIICFQIPPVLLLRDPIHPCRCVTALTPIGPLQSLLINEMAERVKLGFGL